MFLSFQNKLDRIKIRDEALHRRLPEQLMEDIRKINRQGISRRFFLFCLNLALVFGCVSVYVSVCIQKLSDFVVNLEIWNAQEHIPVEILILRRMKMHNNLEHFINT